MTSSKLLTNVEVAERLGIARQTVSWRVARGQLEPVQKLPGRNGAYLFDEEQVDRLAAEAVTR
ncbi:helix-turn-helix domain-containing protein [Brachybacterium paraconglomeratum]|uniref:helix-turn-helix domain-containing protein n=1 Tax=Brachybacterium paraconglomeratum TaxID=173362 RepID=UPI0022AF7A21|nr:helix-turn-helix domain-containing protein [Brachybacterium paraconglomeratum]MCZ4324771.1 helix-turn-helix domain-containing protein [Brachybacterium paraconglomeratum]